MESGSNKDMSHDAKLSRDTGNEDKENWVTVEMKGEKARKKEGEKERRPQSIGDVSNIDYSKSMSHSDHPSSRASSHSMKSSSDRQSSHHGKRSPNKKSSYNGNTSYNAKSSHNSQHDDKNQHNMRSRNEKSSYKETSYDTNSSKNGKQPSSHKKSYNNEKRGDGYRRGSWKPEGLTFGNVAVVKDLRADKEHSYCDNRSSPQRRNGSKKQSVSNAEAPHT